MKLLPVRVSGAICQNNIHFNARITAVNNMLESLSGLIFKLCSRLANPLNVIVRVFAADGQFPGKFVLAVWAHDLLIASFHNGCPQIKFGSACGTKNGPRFQYGIHIRPPNGLRSLDILDGSHCMSNQYIKNLNKNHTEQVIMKAKILKALSTPPAAVYLLCFLGIQLVVLVSGFWRA
ncbi:hypothetical protein [Parendozoicomonas sp. Alg238-R29]|uniref:hypothetical protein n=1 Tax=Parendozoicomonas sp. Alg238-R29 TaxID=2993446 RepID=UPI00248F3E18|nr:hypothetical protein [Parendozoicomonas sp. Alg238-R29]